MGRMGERQVFISRFRRVEEGTSRRTRSCTARRSTSPFARRRTPRRVKHQLQPLSSPTTRHRRLSPSLLSRCIRLLGPPERRRALHPSDPSPTRRTSFRLGTVSSGRRTSSSARLSSTSLCTRRNSLPNPPTRILPSRLPPRPHNPAPLTVSSSPLSRSSRSTSVLLPPPTRNLPHNLSLHPPFTPTSGGSDLSSPDSSRSTRRPHSPSKLQRSWLSRYRTVPPTRTPRWSASNSSTSLSTTTSSSSPLSRSSSSRSRTRNRNPRQANLCSLSNTFLRRRSTHSPPLMLAAWWASPVTRSYRRRDTGWE